LTVELQALTEMRSEARAALDVHRNTVHRMPAAALAISATRWN